MQGISMETMWKGVRIALTGTILGLLWFRFVVFKGSGSTATDAGQAVIAFFVVTVLTMIGSRAHAIILFVRWCSILVSLSLLCLISAVDMTMNQIDGTVTRDVWQLDLAALISLTIFMTTEAAMVFAARDAAVRSPLATHLIGADVDVFEGGDEE